jgi:hypothetical protein
VRRINEKIFKGNKIIVQLDSSSLWKMKEKELQDSDAEMEKSLLMAGLEMKEQRQYSIYLLTHLFLAFYSLRWLV